MLNDNRSLLVGVAGALVLLVYYLVVWFRVGRDPQRGVIMPRYEPPAGLSPAGMRYLVKMGFDNKVAAAAMLDMAVKKYVTIGKSDTVYTLTRAYGEKIVLTPDERLLAEKLLGSDNSLELSPAHHTRVQSAITALKTSLKTSEEKIYFLTNSRYLMPGVIFSALLIAANVLLAPSKVAMTAGAFISVWLTGWSFGVVMLLLMVVASWKAALSGGGGAAAKGGALFLTLFSVPFLAGEVFGISMLARTCSLSAVGLLALVVFLNVLFHYLLKAPTHAGRVLLDQVEGFKMFLGAVDKDRLATLAATEQTPAVFEKYLPYAVALGVEQAWAGRFADVLERAKYSPAWCSDGSWTGMNVGTMAVIARQLDVSARLRRRPVRPAAARASVAEVHRAAVVAGAAEEDGRFKFRVSSWATFVLKLETETVLPQHPNHSPLHLHRGGGHDDRLHGGVRGLQAHLVAFLEDALQGGLHAVDQRHHDLAIAHGAGFLHQDVVTVEDGFILHGVALHLEHEDFL